MKKQVLLKTVILKTKGDDIKINIPKLSHGVWVKKWDLIPVPKKRNMEDTSIKETLGQFYNWYNLGFSKSETPNSKSLCIAIDTLREKEQAIAKIQEWKQNCKNELEHYEKNNMLNCPIETEVSLNTSVETYKKVLELLGGKV